LTRGYTVYVEPSDLVPTAVTDLLKKLGNVHFESREQLMRNNIDFFEIKL
jgi:hypothetical protein